MTVVDWLVIDGVLTVVGFSVVGGVLMVVGFSVVGFSVVANAFAIGGLLARDKNDSTTMVLYHEMTVSSFF